MDRAFDALGNRHRRRVLFHLLAAADSGEGSVDVDGIAAEDDGRHRCAISLRHVHLPKLESAGYVSWDAEEGVVRPGPDFEEVAPVVRLVCENRDELPAEPIPDSASYR